MNDIFFSLDQQLANKLVNSLTIPFTIDAMKPKYFVQDSVGQVNPGDPEIKSLESDLFEASIKSLEYAENRDETIAKESEQEDEELYNMAKIAVDAFLKENPNEAMDAEDKEIFMDYSFKDQKSLWGKIKKHARKAISWLKKQLKKIISITNVVLERFAVTVQKRPVLVISNPVQLNDVYMKINYRITVHYKIFGASGRVSLSDDFSMPNTDLDVRFNVDGMKYIATPHFTNLNIVKTVVGFKITISIASLINKQIKPMVIFDGSKYIPEIPWFEKAFVAQPPLGLSTYRTGLSFGVDFKLQG